MTSRQQGLTALLLTMLVWGFGAVATRFLVEDLDPADVIVIRYAISTSCFVLLFLAIPATVVSLVLWSYGNRHVSAGAAAAEGGVAATHTYSPAP